MACQVFLQGGLVTDSSKIRVTAICAFALAATLAVCTICASMFGDGGTKEPTRSVDIGKSLPPMLMPSSNGLGGGIFNLSGTTQPVSPEELAATVSTYGESAQGSDPASDEPAARKVMCWGDSLTEGTGADEAVIVTAAGTYDASFKSYPQILHDMCGLTVVNYGVPSATSYDVLALCDELLPAKAEGTTDIEDIKEGPVDGVASPVAGTEDAGDILIVEMGSNGGWDGDYDLLIAQYRWIIERSGCRQFIVIGDTDDPGTSAGDEEQSEMEPGDPMRETAWESALREAFGDRFVNMRLYLISHGLEACGLDADEYDWELATRGCLSEKLRSDWTHLNSYGYYAQALGVYERGNQLGYWG